MLILSFLTSKNQESDSQQICGLVTRNISVFVYSESRSTSKPCRIQQNFIKEFPYMLFLFIVQFHCLTCKTTLLVFHFINKAVLKMTKKFSITATTTNFIAASMKMRLFKILTAKEIIPMKRRIIFSIFFFLLNLFIDG